MTPDLTELTLIRPDDWHLHLRDGDMLKGIAPESARDFARAIVMPNLVPPVVTGAQARAYRDRILAALPAGSAFRPLMTLYLTEETDADDLIAAHDAGIVTAVKLYPAGATTNSASGVRDFDKVQPVLERMAEAGVPLCVHGEVTDPDVDIFDREAVFIDTVLDPIRRSTPGLKVTLEHVTTQDGVDYIRDASSGIAGSITTHHLIINRNNLFAGGLRPHYYCLPVAKRETHRLALRQAATSGDPRFFLGTDSAPHPREAKESACGCAGIFNAPFALESYCAVFEDEGALDRFEAFASLSGPAFYRLPVNDEKITLERRECAVPESIDGEAAQLVPFHAGETLRWKLAE